MKHILFDVIHAFNLRKYEMKYDQTFKNPSSSQPSLSSSYWNEDMSTFSSLPPLDIDPLPSLFPFSPCGTSFK